VDPPTVSVLDEIVEVWISSSKDRRSAAVTA